MSQFNTAVNSFLAGELSPRMNGRTEIQQYFQGAAELHNQLVYIQGGTYRRPGSRYYNISNSTDKTQYEGSTYSRGIPYTLADGRRCVVMLYPDTLDNTFDIYDISTGTKQTTWRDAGFSVELGAFTEATLREIQYAQVGDFLILTHGSFPPIFITPAIPASTYGANAIMISRFNETTVPMALHPTAGTVARMPFQAPNISNNQNKGYIEYQTAPSVRLYSSTGHFASGMEGSYFKLSNAGSTVVVRIDSVTSGSYATFSPIVGTPTTGIQYGVAAGSSWEQDCWNDYHGWPRTICAFEQRVYYGGNAAFPDTVWASEIGDIGELMDRRFEQDPDFADALTNDRPYSFTIASTEASKIQWMAAGKTLQIGTLAREYVYKGSEGAMGPLDITGGGESAFGSAYVQPVKYDSALYYVQRSGQSIRELVFNQDEDAYKGNNILTLAEHLVKRSATKHATFSTPKILQVVVQMTENPIVWVLDNNGGLLGGTIDRANNIVAWTYHEIGGALSGEVAKVKSVCVVPSANGENDYLFISVQRTINGSTKTYFEIIGHEFALESASNSSTSLDDKMVYADSCVLTRLGAPGLTFTGFSHLIGQTVDVIADGSYYGQVVVNGSGEVVLTGSNKTEVVAGIPYTSRVKLMPLVPGSPVGTSLGQFLKVDHLTIKTYRTPSFKFGISLTDLESKTLDSAFYTGDARVTLHPGFARETSVYIVQERSLPLSVSCVVAEGFTNA